MDVGIHFEEYFFQSTKWVQRKPIWFIRADDPKSAFKDIDILINSKVFAYKMIGNSRDTYLIHEAYRINATSPLLVNTIGMWSPVSGLIMTMVAFWKRRSNLHGIVFLGATVEVLTT